MYTNKVLVVTLLLAGLLIAGCVMPEVMAITGSGDVVSRELDFANFDRVEAGNTFRVNVTQGDAYRVVIRIDENLERYLDVSQQGGTLRLRLEPGRLYTLNNATLEAAVTMPALRGLKVSGASHGTVTGFESTSPLDVDVSGASTLRGDIGSGDLRVGASGASQVTLSGGGDDAQVNASGASRVDLADFPLGDARVDVSGASQATVNASGTLDVNASGASTVTYLGNPTMGDIETSGASSIRRR